MWLSKNEIKTLVLVASSENIQYPKDISKALDVRHTSVYDIIASLEQKGLVDRNKFNQVVLSIAPPAEGFKKLYYSHRHSPFERIIGERRLDLLSKINKSPKSVKDLKDKTGIPISSIYYYLNDFTNLSVVKKEKKGRAYHYSFNYTLWRELKDFVDRLSEVETLQNIPPGALPIKDYGDHILFKSIRQIDTTPTSFSAYGEYGIQLILRRESNYYTLPKRKLSITDVFIHSLDSADEVSLKLYCILFYQKNKNKLKGVKHPMIKNIRAILRGRHVKGYPSYEEVADRMLVYAT